MHPVRPGILCRFLVLLVSAVRGRHGIWFGSGTVRVLPERHLLGRQGRAVPSVQAGHLLRPGLLCLQRLRLVTAPRHIWVLQRLTCFDLYVAERFY